MVSAIIEVTEQGARDAQEAIERALCPDEGHPGYCSVPWTTLVCKFDDLDPRGRADWEAEFANDRQGARKAGKPGA
jgi:hypothetical protein